eukprot:TRINITY_DN3015_c0_g1_i1.p1 TRINITY_DN3015_c0_g1~~TRINITY_DN3015_c0_g1_i1.p1  ORF type:complete len:1001 (+),score=227.07 TRINITY_DN3015_c0_g1_i1:118-3120(+)
MLTSRESLQREALALLAKLAAQSNTIRRSVGETPGCISGITSALNKDGAGLEVRRSAVNALYEVCKDSYPIRELAFNNNCIAPLLSLISRFEGDTETQGKIVGLIATFTSDNDRFRSAVRDNRGIHALVELVFSLSSTLTPENKNSEKDNLIVSILVSALITLANFVGPTTSDPIRRVADASDIISSGGVLALVPLLSSNYEPLQEYTCLALGNLAMVHPECNSTISSAGGLTSSIPLLSSPNESVLTQALLLLSALTLPLPPPSPPYTENPSHQPPPPPPVEDRANTFLSSGGIPPLISILTSHPSANIRRGAISLLANLLGDVSGQGGNDALWREYVKVGGVPALIAMVGSEHPAAQYRGALTLARVASESPSHRKSIIDCNGIPPLVGLLPSPEMLACCAAVNVLSHLSLEKDCCLQLVDFAAQEHLVKIGSASEQGVFPPEVRFQVGDIFANMAAHSSCRVPLCTAGAIPRLIELLFSAPTTPMATDPQATAAKAIGLLASDQETAQSVYDQGGLLALLPLLSPPYKSTTRSSAALALATLCRHYPPSRTALLTTNEENQTKENVNGNSSAPSTPTLSASGSTSSTPLGSILHIMTSGPDDNLRLLMLELMETLSNETGFAPLIESNGGLNRLINLLDYYQNKNHNNASIPSSPTLLSIAPTTEPLIMLLSIISNLAKDSKARILLLRNGLLPLINRILMPPPSPSLLVQLDELSIEEKQDDKEKFDIGTSNDIECKAVEIIGNLCSNEEGRVAIYEAAMIKPLLRIMGRSFKMQPSLDGAMNSNSLATLSSRTISLLSLNEANRDSIREVGGVDVFVSILKPYTTNSPMLPNGNGTSSSSPSTLPSLAHVMASIDNLSFNEKNIEVMFSRGLMSAVISLLGSPSLVGDESTQVRVLRLLRNLSSHPTGYERMSQLLMCNGMSALRGLIGTMFAAQSDRIPTMALDVLVNLSRGDKCRKGLCDLVEEDRVSFVTLLDHCKKRGLALTSELTEILGI